MWGFSPYKHINRNKVDRHFWKKGYWFFWGGCSWIFLPVLETMDSGFNLNAFIGFQLYR